VGYWQDIRYFKSSEFACKCGLCGLDGTTMDMAFMLALDALRERCGFPFIVNSGLRCPTYNFKISTSGPHGPHTTGHAADIRVYGERAWTLVTQSKKFGMAGVGVQQKGPHGSRFVHLDDLPDTSSRPRPAIWSY
jgi:zinc D-Ala-D-Ala carboxypeptidase